VGKKVIFAVAGSGKTTKIVEQLDETRCHLLVTYTKANRDNLRNKIVRKFGHFPSGIKLYTYFEFLYGFCYRPFLQIKKKTKGIIFGSPPEYTRTIAETNDARFISSGGYLYHNRLAKFIEQTQTLPLVIARMEKYFDVFYVDEVQDFSGHDFKFLLGIAKADLDCLFVGDFYQYTYPTSQEGNVEKNLHGNYLSYQERFRKAGIEPDTESLKVSRRCSKSVCDFIASSIGIEIDSFDDRKSEVRLEKDPSKVMAVYNDPSIVKLFYQKHDDYECYSQNWGASKGVDHYQDVCVVLSDENIKAFEKGNFGNLAQKTKNKLYVACSRARGNLIFVPDRILKPHKKVRAVTQ